VVSTQQRFADNTVTVKFEKSPICSRPVTCVDTDKRPDAIESYDVLPVAVFTVF
jgi:hypothetical protein